MLLNVHVVYLEYFPCMHCDLLKEKGTTSPHISGKVNLNVLNCNSKFNFCTQLLLLRLPIKLGVPNYLKKHKQVHIPARISTAQLDLEESLQTPSMSPFNLEEIGAITQWGSQVLGRAQNNYCLIPRRSASIQSEQYSGSFPIYQDLVLGLHMDYLQLKKMVCVVDIA